MNDSQHYILSKIKKIKEIKHKSSEYIFLQNNPDSCQILDHFNLPYCGKYLSIINDKIPFNNPEKDAIKIYEELTKTSIEYKKLNLTSHIEILQKSQSGEIESHEFDILPMLNTSIDPYQIFLYREMYLERKENPVDILIEMNEAEGYLYELDSLLGDNAESSYLIIQSLRKKLNYLEEYVEYIGLNDFK